MGKVGRVGRIDDWQNDGWDRKQTTPFQPSSIAVYPVAPSPHKFDYETAELTAKEDYIATKKFFSRGLSIMNYENYTVLDRNFFLP